MKIRIEKKETKQRCRFWAGRHTGQGFALYCKDKKGLRAYAFSVKSLSGTHLVITKAPETADDNIVSPWCLGIKETAHNDGHSTIVTIAMFDTEKEALAAQKCAINAIRSMRVPSRAWVYWLIAVILVVGVMVASIFSVGVVGKGGAASMGKSQAATALQLPPSNLPAQSYQAVPVEPPSRVNLSLLPPANHAWGFGNPKGKPLYVFSDPTCHYCGELDRALKVAGKDYYIHLYPTPVRGKDAVALVANFACSSNPQTAWSDWMESNKFDEKVQIKPECSSPALAVANSNIGIMKALGFKGVPVLIRADGAAINGAMTTDELVAWLSQSSQ